MRKHKMSVELFKSADVMAPIPTNFLHGAIHWKLGIYILAVRSWAIDGTFLCSIVHLLQSHVWTVEITLMRTAIWLMDGISMQMFHDIMILWSVFHVVYRPWSVFSMEWKFPQIRCWSNIHWKNWISHFGSTYGTRKCWSWKKGVVLFREPHQATLYSNVYSSFGWHRQIH